MKANLFCAAVLVTATAVIFSWPGWIWSDTRKNHQVHSPENTRKQQSARTMPGKAGKTKKEPPLIPHGTFIKELSHAPFPYRGKYADTKIDFFDYVDPATGERFRTMGNGDRLPERIHYRDNRVLFHIPDHFDPHKPFFYVVFFHGILMDVETCVRDYLLKEQVNASKRNSILIVPQFAWNAPDSSPGKFFRAGAFKAFMHEASDVLARVLGKSYQKELEQAPVILAAFSGGYRSVAYILDRGGVDARVRGVLLLDALYDDVEKYQKWLGKNVRRSFFLHLFTEGSCEENSLLLASFLERRRISCRTEWPEQIRPGGVYFVKSATDHMKIPLDGPPPEPLKRFLQSVRW